MDIKDKVGKLIDQYSGERLWKETVMLAVKTNPTIAREVDWVIQDNKQTRAELVDQKFATNESNSMRLGLRMPTSVSELLAVVDPESFPYPAGEDGIKVVRKLAKTFPEFTIPEKL